ncbi:HAD-like domain-containing protein [Xylaria telfairii]|nr:HAD-like domain-containing protein [Xylaria telfairii]
MQDPSVKDLQVRCFIACPRSGSAFLMRILSESPECAVTSRLIPTRAAAVVTEFPTDYSILQNVASHELVQRATDRGKRILICKEGLDNELDQGECTCNLLPSPSEYATVRPMFLVRDPVLVFDSWKKVGWTDIRGLIHCFSTLFRMLEQADSTLTSCLLYEQLVEQPCREIERVCAFWGIPFSYTMLKFSAPFASSFLHENPAAKDTYCYQHQTRLLSTLEDSVTILENVPCHGLVTNNEKTMIEDRLGRLYLACWKDHVSQLHDSLAEKRWIGFDLDDTLHEFRLASSAASDKVLETMHERYGIPFASLKHRYSEILQTSTSNAFTDGKTSSEYRRERFLAVASHFFLPLEYDDLFLSELLHIYETSLKESLELKSGALSLLRTVKRLGKKIVVITEGPQDAQEWTVENLGISPYIDFLATTNHFKISKTDGLS